MELPRSLRSGAYWNEAQVPGWSQALFMGAECGLALSASFQSKTPLWRGCREGVAGYLPLEWVVAYGIARVGKVLSH